MLEMSREGFLAYSKALTNAIFNYAQGKDVERNGKKARFIFKEFGIKDIDLDKLVEKLWDDKSHHMYWNTYYFVENLFYNLSDKVTLF